MKRKLLRTISPRVFAVSVISSIESNLVNGLLQEGPTCSIKSFLCDMGETYSWQNNKIKLKIHTRFDGQICLYFNASRHMDDIFFVFTNTCYCDFYVSSRQHVRKCDGFDLFCPIRLPSTLISAITRLLDTYHWYQSCWLFFFCARHVPSFSHKALVRR